MKVNVKIKRLNDAAVIPQYQTEGAAGFDLYANEDVLIPIGEHRLIRTGLSFEIPPDFEIQIRSRSGLALKNGLQAHFATIDSDYRGEVGVILFNFGNKPFLVEIGDRVAQGIVAKAEKAFFQEVGQLSETTRGTGGFGSSGVKS